MPFEISRQRLLLMAIVATGCAGEVATRPTSVGANSTSAEAAEQVAAPVAPAKTAAPPTPAKTGTVAGVTFRVPETWTLVNEEQLSFAKSPDGKMGFVLSGLDDASGLHRAEAESNATFSLEFKSLKKQVPLGSLPLGFAFTQTEKQEGGRTLRATMFSGANSAREPIQLFVWVSVPVSGAEAEVQRVSATLDEIYHSFAPAK